MYIHYIDFNNEPGRMFLKELGMTEKDAIECQLAAVLALASTDVAERLAHAEPSEKFVEMIAGSTLSGMLSSVLGDGSTGELRSVIRAVIHMPCILSSLLQRMVDLGALDLNRANTNAQKIFANVEKLAALMASDDAKHKKHVH